MQALPRDAKTLVLRTLARGELPIPDEDRWHFSVQTLDDFIARMESTQAPATEVQDFMPEMVRSARSGSHGLSFLGAVTEQPRPLLPWTALPPLRLLTPESMPLLPCDAGTDATPDSKRFGFSCRHQRLDQDPAATYRRGAARSATGAVADAAAATRSAGAAAAAGAVATAAEAATGWTALAAVSV
jgi:hypothetical protein